LEPSRYLKFGAEAGFRSLTRSALGVNIISRRGHMLSVKIGRLP
jgi:hypothetical protein